MNTKLPRRVLLEILQKNLHAFVKIEGRNTLRRGSMNEFSEGDLRRDSHKGIPRRQGNAL